MEAQIKENAERLQKLAETGGNFSELQPLKELENPSKLSWTTKYTIDFAEKEKIRKPKYIPYP